MEIIKHYLGSKAKFEVESSMPDCEYITGVEYEITPDLIEKVLSNKCNGSIIFQSFPEASEETYGNFLYNSYHRLHNEGFVTPYQFNVLCEAGIDVFSISNL